MCKALLLPRRPVGPGAAGGVVCLMNTHPSTLTFTPTFTPTFTAARHLLPWLCLALMAAALPALAQSADDAEDTTVTTQEADPPGRVGRIAELEGQVWLRSAVDREWLSAERNQPLTSGDRLSTDRSANAEMRVGSTVLRLDAHTEIELLRLDDDHFQVHLHRGAAQVLLRDSEWAQQFEWVTAEGRFVTDQAGSYRVDRRDTRTHATVLKGQLRFEGRNQTLTMAAGQRAEFVLGANGRAQYALVEPQRDAFTAWNQERDRAERTLADTPRYVSPEMTGAEELDRHGSWEQDPEVGALWIPHRVAAGWAPYTTGRWAWVRPWGWTWIDAAPWGFAPFHYGRWLQRGHHWAWAPGRYVSRPVYSPALVGWGGAGPPVYRPGVTIDISLGRSRGYDWYPLSPRDRYVPHYRHGSRHERAQHGSSRYRDHHDAHRDPRLDHGYDRHQPSRSISNIDRVPDHINRVSPHIERGRGLESPLLPSAPAAVLHRSRDDDRRSDGRDDRRRDDARRGSRDADSSERDTRERDTRERDARQRDSRQQEAVPQRTVVTRSDAAPTKTIHEWIEVRRQAQERERQQSPRQRDR